MSRKLKYLWVYSAANDWVNDWHQRLIKRRKDFGYDVDGFCITPSSLRNRWLPFYELDQKWREGDRVLTSLYRDLTLRLRGVDVLILYNGANLHPEYLLNLDCIKVFTAGDDPESTEILSKPVAKYFDIHLVNNVAELDMYKKWGLKNVHFWPLGSLCFEDEVALKFDVRDLQSRSIKGCFIGERQAARDARMNQVYKEFPDCFYAGKGWEKGPVSWCEMWDIYRHAQVGWNMHRSTGPINFRTYELAAYGILQLCDNKSNLGKIYKLDEEVIGFDSVEECIELTHEYLSNKSKQRDIAYNGWLRWQKDYTPDAVWRTLDEIVCKYVDEENIDLGFKKTNESQIYKELARRDRVRIYSIPKKTIKKLLRGGR